MSVTGCTPIVTGNRNLSKVLFLLGEGIRLRGVLSCTVFHRDGKHPFLKGGLLLRNMESVTTVVRLDFRGLVV